MTKASPGSLTVSEAIARCRQARRFDPNRPVDPDLLLEIIGQAASGPMPWPLQPARFVAVRSLANRRRLRLATFGDARLTDAPVVVAVLGALDPARTDLAPLVLEAVESGAISPESANRLRAEVPRGWARLGPEAAAERSAAMAAGTLILAAEGHQLAAAWVDDFDRDKVRDALGVPDDHRVVTLVAIGHPLEAGPPTPRKPVDQVLHAEHFGQPWATGIDHETEAGR